MNEKTLEKISAEFASVLTGQKFGKIFTLARFRLAIDFRLTDSDYLFISVEPSEPRIYLIKRRLRDLEKQSINPTSFVLCLRKRLANAVLETVEKVESERILNFYFLARNEIGRAENYTLVAQLTGRSANLFLLDANDFILDAVRETFGNGQEIASKYAPPSTQTIEPRKNENLESFPQGKFKTLSEAVDAGFLEKEAEKVFRAKAQAAQSKLKQEIQKREKLIKKLEKDLENHGDAQNWKRLGDLLLANLMNAKRTGDKVFVTDFYDENTPTIEIEVEENIPLSQAAEKFFRRYTKARNALEEISQRLTVSENELTNLRLQKERLDNAVDEKDESVLAEFVEAKPEKLAVKIKERQAENFTGARRYKSSDGFEILVGKASKDNDFLTFRVAKSADLWMHAADYPGSHVVVRNPNRQEIPPKTLLEAAQIAAFFSQAKTQAKVAVHYTPKKFVNKPKGASAGLVSLSSFKTILVEPKVFESKT
ncbi:MAG: NFACT family protein [Acidobacteriota bacterium]|nr:NFACT family protein [Acidobacteriota bacterium]